MYLAYKFWRRKPGGSIEGLLKALELSVSLDIRQINLSAGTYAYEDFARIEEAVRYLLDSDRILVAATGNRGTVTYPAYLPDVIGVEYRQELIDDAYIYCQDLLTRIDFQASSRHKIVLGGHEIDTPISNNYAAPLITAKILTILRSNQKQIKMRY